MIRAAVTQHCGSERRLVTAGGHVKLAPEVPHAEHDGPEGATFRVARRD